MSRRFTIVFFLMITIIGQSAIAATNTNDIRVVIDVSGSMKKTDPLNLRIPAMKMLNGLIPNGSYAGVWNFGRYVDMTVKWGKVDNAWRKRADRGAAKIHSNGLYTNIESALARATTGWEKADAKTQRSIILLTDGQVDISKDKAKNEASRNTVLTKSIAALKKAGVSVHAIALSKDADETLLKQLALDTGGSFETAETAQALQKIFLKLFERATDPDLIELDGNEFVVDRSIKEMTLLIFRPKDSKLTQLYPPEAAMISADSKGTATWSSEEGYDLITIKKPKAGTWRIDAYRDPDNRLLVVTDLQLKLLDVPPYMTPAQPLTIAAELHNKDNKISKNSFLRFVEFELTHIDEAAVEHQLPLTHTKVRKDKGQYLHALDGNLAEGKHSFIVTINSRTFNRSKRIDVEVQWPVKVEIQPTAEPGNYRLAIQAREEYLKPETLLPKVQIQAPDGVQTELMLENVAGVWQSEVITRQAGLYQALIQISADSINGEKQQHDLGAYSMVGVYKDPALDTDPEFDADTDQNLASPEIEVIASSEDEQDWMKIIIIVGIANLVFFLVMGAIFFMYKRSARKSEFSLDDDQNNEMDIEG